MEVTSGTGNNKLSWKIPKAMLTHHSGYFYEVCYRPFGGTDKLSLPYCDPQRFRVFVQWMYYRIIPESNLPSETTLWPEGVDLWIMGDYLQAPAFQNYIMQIFYEALMGVDVPIDLSIADAYTYWLNARENSSLRRFIVDYAAEKIVYARNLTEAHWLQIFRTCPAFRYQLFLAIAESVLNEPGQPKHKPLSAYLEDELE